MQIVRKTSDADLGLCMHAWTHTQTYTKQNNNLFIFEYVIAVRKVTFI